MKGAELLLPGEEDAGADAAESAIWIDIYTQLAELTSHLLNTVGNLATSSERGADRLEISELARRHQLYDEGRARWQQRHWELAGLNIDHESRTVSNLGRQRHLTRREHELLAYLASSPGRFVHPQRIISGAWPGAAVSVQQLRNYVTRLRRVIEDLGIPCVIVNRPGVGYSLVSLVDPGPASTPT